jgi:hypothetical protein
VGNTLQTAFTKSGTLKNVSTISYRLSWKEWRVHTLLQFDAIVSGAQLPSLRQVLVGMHAQSYDPYSQELTSAIELYMPQLTENALLVVEVGRP